MTVNPKNSYKMNFTDHLWLQFLDQPQSDAVLFAINFFLKHILNILTDWKHGISTDDIIPFNEASENLSTEIVELKKKTTSLHMKRKLHFFTLTSSIVLIMCE